MQAPRVFLRLLIASTVALLAAQVIPYGRDHSAPPDGAQTAWSSSRTRELAQRACFDCHSNQTRWPWYSHVAPVSWRVFQHVQEGREKLNFTAFDAGNKDVTHAAGEAGEKVTKRDMPPADYLLAHPEARLDAAERRALAAGLDSTFAAYAEHGRGSGEREKSGRPR